MLLLSYPPPLRPYTLELSVTPSDVSGLVLETEERGPDRRVSGVSFGTRRRTGSAPAPDRPPAREGTRPGAPKVLGLAPAAKTQALLGWHRVRRAPPQGLHSRDVAVPYPAPGIQHPSRPAPAPTDASSLRRGGRRARQAQIKGQIQVERGGVIRRERRGAVGALHPREPGPCPTRTVHPRDTGRPTSASLEPCLLQ